ncbi:MAG: hypothetical protein C0392_04135 [Syntrophus sp. (in: bacteria)]|nr:hypothetical protein [Syntrophus sp. (in: bacteria)]
MWGIPPFQRKAMTDPATAHIHDRDMAWLSACDCVVAEVSVPSLGVGYELGRATTLSKPVLCLHRTISGRPISAMIAGSPGIQAAAYVSIEEAETIMGEFIRKTVGHISTSIG